jgi:hypothetical protein
MKTRRKQKRKLTEEERRKAVRSVLKRSATDLFYIWKIAPRRDKPPAVAKYLALELFACPPRGARLLSRVVERRWNEKRFVALMLKALGKHLLHGPPNPLDDLDIEILKLQIKFNGRISIARMFGWLSESLTGPNPDKKFRELFKKRVRRLRRLIPPEYFGGFVMEGQK